MFISKKTTAIISKVFHLKSAVFILFILKTILKYFSDKKCKSLYLYLNVHPVSSPCLPNKAPCP